jgi:hypothetical protein
LVQADDGRRILEVVFNVSSVSWTRLVLLGDHVRMDAIDALVEEITYRSERVDVSDVEGADELLPVSARILWPAASEPG